MADTLPQSPASPLSIREADPSAVDELHLILDTWIQGFWRLSPWARRLTWAVFNGGHRPVVVRLLSRSRVLIASEPSTGEIVGYLVHEGATVLHWVYVKEAWRRAGRGRLLPEGVATTLVRAAGLPVDLAGVTVTHPTYAWLGSPALTDKQSGAELKGGAAGIQARCPGATTNPYLWVNA